MVCVCVCVFLIVAVGFALLSLFFCLFEAIPNGLELRILLPQTSECSVKVFLGGLWLFLSLHLESPVK